MASPYWVSCIPPPSDVTSEYLNTLFLFFPRKWKGTGRICHSRSFHYWPPFSVTRFSCVHPSQRCSVLHGSGIHDPHGQRIVGQFYRKWVVSSPQNMATFWFQNNLQAPNFGVSTLRLPPKRGYFLLIYSQKIKNKK